MEKTLVQSSNLVSIGYDAESQTLEIEFKGKDRPTYRYKEVPADVAEALVKAESPGKQFHAVIKPNYQATKVEVSREEG